MVWSHGGKIKIKRCFRKGDHKHSAGDVLDGDIGLHTTLMSVSND